MLEKYRITLRKPRKTEWFSNNLYITKTTHQTYGTIQIKNS